MKKVLAITFMVEEKEVRKAMALLTGDALSDDGLDKNFFNDPVQIDTDELGEESKNMIIALTALIADKKGYL